jgi:hypothetical protein
MKTVMRFTLAVLTIGAMLGMSGCTDQATRNTLTVVSVNGGNTYFSDLVNVEDPLNPFVPVDQVKVEFGNIRNGGGEPLAPGSPFSEIVVTGYTVTYDNGIFSPVTGGMNVRVSSGSTNEASILLSDSGEKGALIGMSGTVTTIARIHFTGYNYVNGYNNGEPLYADAALSVQVGDFGDSNTNP